MTRRSLSRTGEDDRAIALWLLLCAAMIVVMMTLGGVTRLTHSGLSIAEWRPLAGVVPPLGQAEWERLFELYRETPEYRQLNPDMPLPEFKGIFWWEYAHRAWGRLIGLAFAVPLAAFLWRRRIGRPLGLRLLVVFALGALQGVLGWFLVASGLVERPDVSQYRLVAHLALALGLYSYMLWTALALLRPPPLAAGLGRLRRLLKVALALTALTIVFGGFVAGLDAGLVYNTFPLMGGRLVPEDLLALTPAWLNAFENPSAAQFMHRVLALTLLGLALWVGWWSRAPGLPRPLRLAGWLVAVGAALQTGVGVATLLLEVPVPLAALHQAGAAALLSLVLWALVEARGPRVFPFYNAEVAR